MKRWLLCLDLVLDLHSCPEFVGVKVLACVVHERELGFHLINSIKLALEYCIRVLHTECLTIAIVLRSKVAYTGINRTHSR